MNYIDEENAIQAAMLADANDEGLSFVRLQDSEEASTAKLQRLLREYLTRLHYLFVAKGAAQVEGYTMHMMRFLKKAPCECPSAFQHNLIRIEAQNKT